MKFQSETFANMFVSLWNSTWCHDARTFVGHLSSFRLHPRQRVEENTVGFSCATGIPPPKVNMELQKKNLYFQALKFILHHPNLVGGATFPSWKIMEFVNGFRMTSHIWNGKKNLCLKPPTRNSVEAKHYFEEAQQCFFSARHISGKVTKDPRLQRSRCIRAWRGRSKLRY